MKVVVVMGVSGCGKSTVGALLAQALGGDYAEGDSFHPPQNVAKMARGEPLDDDDRGPWLQAMADAIAGWRQAGRPTVLSCSALKRRYRDVLRSGGGADLRFVHLSGAQALIAERLAQRRNHYMPASLLASQFAALEPPGADEVVVIPIDGSPEQIAAEAMRRLGS